MTGNTTKTRAVILAALMVFSVFAGTVAFTGSAAAGTPTYTGNAVHYVNESGSGTPVVEVPFEGGTIDVTTVSNSSFTLLDDGDNASAYVENYEVRDGAVYIEVNQTIASNDLEVDISDTVQSTSNDPVSNPGEKSIIFAGQTLEFDESAPTPSSPANSSAYQGSVVAIETNATNTDVTVEGEDNNYFSEGSTGTNSTVFTFDTSDREIGEYRVFVAGSDDSNNRTFINVRDLQLDVEVDDLNVTNEDTIEGTVSAVAGGRNVDIDLLDSSGDSVNTTNVNLNGQGEYDFEFNTQTADDGSVLETGTYTVEVTDTTSGVATESSDIEVSEAADEDVDFASNVISNQRGDFLEATVELTSTDTATLSFGSQSDGVVANATVEDDDGDGQVTVYLNTYNMQNGNDVYSLDSDSDDVILDQNNPTKTSDLIDAGDYDFEVQAGDQGVGTGVTSSDDVATVTLEERSTDALRMWTGSSDEIGSVSDLEDVNEALDEGQITQSSEVAVGDLAVHQLEASGFEGALDARDNELVTQEFVNLNRTGPINLTIEEADPGANQAPSELALDSTNNLTVIADGENDTYFIIVDTGEAQFKGGEDLPADDDTALETNFTVINRDAGYDFTPEGEFDSDENEETILEWGANEPDVTVSQPYNVSQASGQSISGTTNIAPGTELNLRVRSQSGTSPSFLKTASPVVESDGTWSAEFDFSEQNVGDEYDIVVNANILASATEEEGTVVEAVETDTATPEPDTDTPEPDTDTPEPDTDTPEPDTDTPEPDTETSEPTETSTPGFGVVVALTALLAAALLATRRD
ncbi:DUF7827 domain-containing protein [Halobellus limi]|uniref:PGF-CTERM protein/surface glycoprotein n=1 Tax=Halobellus limi TaxID=699433 RepID=A0A1H5UU74_9EURY|nr:BGTF surface domain-containing protein [Halobellus limi]QCC48854.1 PGF-CTERM sorting domain-containing protein [Halobellus limi]SEF78682.1 PGF-CTERM protein/surface glycoprotein [Halobellus limi]